MSGPARRPCEPCGASGDDCPWCTSGQQGPGQQAAWAAFRRRMKKISGTYTFLIASVEDVLRRVEASGRPGAVDLLVEGKRSLLEWDMTDPVDGNRNKVTMGLLDFQRRAIDFLTER